MKLLTSSRLLGLLLLLATIPVDSGAALAARATSPNTATDNPGSVEARMRRITMALKDTPPPAEANGAVVGPDALTWWRDGFRRYGGFRDGGFGDGGFRNGGFRNGGFRNGFWVNI